MIQYRAKEVGTAFKTEYPAADFYPSMTLCFLASAKNTMSAENKAVTEPLPLADMLHEAKFPYLKPDGSLEWRRQEFQSYWPHQIRSL